MSPGDERFAQSMADLSSRLRERMAVRPRTDPITALKRRQAALRAYDHERRQKLLVMLGGVGCVVAASALAWGIVMLAEPADVPLPAAASTVAPGQVADVEPAIPRTQASPTVAAAAEPAAPPAISTIAPPEAGQLSIAMSAQPLPPVPALGRGDVAEVQRLLTAFGFNPGPIDGSAGPRTLDAIQRYQEKRGLPQTSALDQGILRQLRQDPSPRTVSVAQRPAAPLPASPPPRRPNAGVFEPVRLAGQQITNWLSAVFR
jgi:hypothetical protein